MDQFPFSVAMSVYRNDKATYFDRALKSIITEQSVKPSEVVLVCDGPLNNELESVIDKYLNTYPIFNVIRLPENKGLGNALKLAVENASYELVARMDSDDVSIPNRFEQQIRFFKKNPNIDIVGGDITEFIDSEENVVGRREVPKNDVAIKEYMKKRCAMNHVSVMYKKSTVQAAGGYLEWFWNEDYYLWIRMQLNGAKFANTGSVLVNVRVGNDMYQRRGGLKYFKSEEGIQKFMLNNKMINLPRYVINVTKRFVMQLVLPNRIRGFVYRKLARTNVDN